MATCKNCLHNNVCGLWRLQERQDAKCYAETENGECDYFAEESQFVKLPDHKTLFYTAEMMLEQWNETTGAIPPSTSWYYELLSIIEDTVKLSFGAGILYKSEAEAAIAKRSQK